MTFLAYRFLPAAALVGARLLAAAAPPARAAGWRAGLVMGVFLTAGYVAQTFGLEHTTASNAGFITGLFVVLTPLFGALAVRAATSAGRPGRRPACRRSACCCSRVPAATST